MSRYGLGLDNMLRSYCIDSISQKEIEDAFIEQTNWDLRKGRPYVVEGSQTLAQKMKSASVFEGFTGTAGGFYGPQGRVLRLPLQTPEIGRA
ncbi:hypothetical protein V6O07_13225, partial [Arthrospira platensis SPKY2]